MMPLHFQLLLFSVILALAAAQHYGSLWCHQGSVEFSPAQCEPSTLDCFKFVCNHTDAGFVARGCGVTVSKTATGLKKESCNQALAMCQQVGGQGTCHTCNDVHMCNESALHFTFPLILLFILRFAKFIL